LEILASYFELLPAIAQCSLEILRQLILPPVWRLD